VISDTHLRGYDERLKIIVERYFHDVELILHTGDLVDISVLDVFRGRKIMAVYGNMDPFSVQKSLPESLIFEVGGFRLGMMHGWGNADNLEEKIYQLLKPVDCVIYGHTHCPVNKIKNGILFFNPGSAFDKRYARENTLGILDIGDEIRGTIVEI
jgi:putative phosphoesterase